MTRANVGQKAHPGRTDSPAGAITASGFQGELPYDSHGMTAGGEHRRSNQDQFLIADLGRSLLIRQTSLSQADHSRLLGPPQGRLLVVADGMSGNPGGEVASSVAVDSLARYVVGIMPWLFGLDARAQDDLQGELAAAIARCQSRVRAASRTQQGYATMGTTLTMAYVVWPRTYVVHLGDSRGYLFRQGHLARMTRDHTVASQLEEEGALTPEEAARSSWRNVLWNAVGAAESTDPDVCRVALQEGDALLLCTDGLTEALGEGDIRDVLSLPGSAEETTKALVEGAIAAGATDDVTAVVARFA